jgi:hypothetical protein
VSIDFAKAGRTHMLRIALSAVVLAGILATAHPVLADPLAANASDSVLHAASATERPVPAPASFPSPDAAASENAELGKAPVGFGWG